MTYFLIRDTGTVRLSADTETAARTAAANLMASDRGEGRLVAMPAGYGARCVLVEEYSITGVKTPGQRAYEADVAMMPTYEDGSPRPKWDDLYNYARETWERNPTGRHVTTKTCWQCRGTDAGRFQVGVHCGVCFGNLVVPDNYNPTSAPLSKAALEAALRGPDAGDDGATLCVSSGVRNGR